MKRICNRITELSQPLRAGFSGVFCKFWIVLIIFCFAFLFNSLRDGASPFALPWTLRQET